MPIHGGVMSRRRIETVWDALHIIEPLRIEEIEAKTGLKKSAVQKALYVLMAEGRAVRAPVIMEKNVGRPIFEYTKINIPTNESVDDRQRRITEETVVNLLPREKESAVTVSELAKKLDASQNTVRTKLLIAEARGNVAAVRRLSERNQDVTKYYRI
jgi:predicted ArsR family transcriptional regulator